MKMKNKELVAHINGLSKVIGQEKARGNDEKVFSGRVNLLMVRNHRAMYKEYRENYLKDYDELRGRFFTTKETEEVVPASGDIEEYTEKRTVEVLKPDCKQEQYDEEFKTLFNLEVSVPIRMIKPEDVEKVTDFDTLDILDFMIE